MEVVFIVIHGKTVLFLIFPVQLGYVNLKILTQRSLLKINVKGKELNYSKIKLSLIKIF